MYQTDQATAVASMPTPAAQGSPGFFTNGNPATGTPATILDADFMNMLMMELANVVTGAGLTLTKNQFNQVLSAIKRLGQATIILADTGAANAYTATNATPLVAGTWVDGVVQQVKIAHANTGASTYAPDGLPAIPIYGLGLQPLQGGELFVGGAAVLMRATIAGVNSGNPVAVLMECAGGAQQVAGGSYGVTPSQLDNSTKLSTTAWAMQYVNGRYGVVNVTGAFGLGSNHINSRVALSGSGSYAVTLPPANQCPAGAGIFLFNNTQSGSATIQASGTDGLNLGAVGQPTGVQISTDQFVWVVTDGATGWYCVMQNIYGFAPNQFDNSARFPTTTWVNLRGVQTSGISTVTASSTLTASTAGGTVVGNAASAITTTLPAASAVAAGARVQFLNINTGAQTVSRNGSTDTITVNNGTVTSLTLNNGDTLTLESNGSNGWYAVGGSVQLQYAAIMKLARTQGSSGVLRIPAYPGDPAPMIIQWGQFTGSSTTGAAVAVSFPAAFPNAISQLLLTTAGSTTTTFSAWYDSQTTTGFNGHSNNPSAACSYLAIGY